MHPARIFFFANCAFIIGVACAAYDLSLTLGIVVWSVVLIGVAFFSRQFLMIVSIIPVAAGSFYYHFFLTAQAYREYLVYGEPLAFTGIIVDEPQQSERAQFLIVEAAEPFRGKIRIIASPAREFFYGDFVSMQGVISERQSPNEMPTSVFPDIRREATGQGNPLRHTLLSIKRHFLLLCAKLLPHDEAALLQGILLGERGGFSDALKGAMALSGTTHLVALSGYNIAVIVVAVATFARKLLTRRTTFLVTAFAILLFVGMVGAEASVLRAALMGILALIALETGRLYDIGNAIACVAAVMLIIDPRTIADVGFHLSFVSLLGIVYFSPVLNAFLPTKSGIEKEWSKKSWLRELVLTTVAAQTAVMPLLLYIFGTVSLSSFLANAIILPALPLAMFLGFMLLLLGSIAVPLASLIALPLSVLLAGELFLITFFATWRVPLYSFFATLPTLILIYAVLGAGLLAYHRTYATR